MFTAPFKDSKNVPTLHWIPYIQYKCENIWQPGPINRGSADWIDDFGAFIKKRRLAFHWAVLIDHSLKVSRESSKCKRSSYFQGLNRARVVTTGSAVGAPNDLQVRGLVG